MLISGLICKRGKRITDGILWIHSFAVYGFKLHLNGNIRVKDNFDNDDDEPFMKYFFHFFFARITTIQQIYEEDTI